MKVAALLYCTKGKPHLSKDDYVDITDIIKKK